MKAPPQTEPNRRADRVQRPIQSRIAFGSMHFRIAAVEPPATNRVSTLRGDTAAAAAVSIPMPQEVATGPPRGETNFNS
jgi:hypothetical protein